MSNIMSNLKKIEEIKSLTMVSDDRIDGLIEIISPFYLKTDKAHGLDHVLDVTITMIKMKIKLFIKDESCIDENILVAGLCHDMFSTLEDRKIHNEKGAIWISKNSDKLQNLFQIDNTRAIELAILEHRSSWKQEFSSTLSELISSADRGYLNLDDMIERSLKYHNGNMEEVIKHMREKFGRTGYAKYPQIFLDFHDDDLEYFYDDIDSL